MERFLFRLSVSPYCDKFILKGALMLSAWGAPSTRPTRDIDLLGYLPNQMETLVETIREICLQEVELDALIFDSASATGMVIKEDADYEGVRITFRGSLDNIPIPMQIDIGFGDIVFPAALVTEYPVILNHSRPKLRCYSRETAIAEKFEAMVKLGLLNSRMKDFFDIWLLSRQFEFDGTTLCAAIRATFERRRTPLPTIAPPALTLEFGTDRHKSIQWMAFIKKGRLVNQTPPLGDVVVLLEAFLMPPTLEAEPNASWNRHWQPTAWT